MRARSLLFVLASAFAATTAYAHLPVMRADPVWASQGGEVVLRATYGHPAEAKWLAFARPDQVTVYAPDGAVFDATPSLTSVGEPSGGEWQARFKPIQTGDHVALYRGRSRIGKTRFDDAIKVVVHAGGAPKGWDRTVGTPVEFVPLTRPYALPKGASFRARLLVGGKPMANKIVGLEHLSATPPPKGKFPSELHMIRQERTNAQGEFTVTLPEEGWWVLFASAAAGTLEEGGETLNRKDRGIFMIPVGW